MLTNALPIAPVGCLLKVKAMASSTPRCKISIGMSLPCARTSYISKPACLSDRSTEEENTARRTKVSIITAGVANI